MIAFPRNRLESEVRVLAAEDGRCLAWGEAAAVQMGIAFLGVQSAGTQGTSKNILVAHEPAE